MPGIETARQASLTARQARTLDKLWRDRTTGETYTLRGRLEAGHYAYAMRHAYSDGTTSYGLISHEDAASALEDAPAGGRSYYPGADNPLQGLTFATYTECPKLAYDYAAERIASIEIGPDRFDVFHILTAEDEAHLFGTVSQ